MDSQPQFEISDNDRKFMKMACDIACENIDCGGGPFGAVIVKDGEVLAAAGNSVTLSNDPTAHAVINALRMACDLTRNFKLDGCVVYSSCEPCPMCLGALYLAGVSRIYYGNTADDADRIGFNDFVLYKDFNKPHLERAIPCIHMEGTSAIESINKWANEEDKIEY